MACILAISRPSCCTSSSSRYFMSSLLDASPSMMSSTAALRAGFILSMPMSAIRGVSLVSGYRAQPGSDDIGDRLRRLLHFISDVFLEHFALFCRGIRQLDSSEHFPFLLLGEERVVSRFLLEIHTFAGRYLLGGRGGPSCLLPFEGRCCSFGGD